jgi:hypothetical protein
MPDPSAFAPFDFAQSYGRGLQVREMQEQQQNKRRLADLLPRAVAGDKAAIQQIAQVDPRLFMQLDERQRAQAKAELDDVSGAVRWALSDPATKAQRWNQVVDYYSRHLPEVAQYRDHPEMAESALMQLGQIGEYLKDAPKPEYKAIEAGGSLIDVSGGKPHVVIAPNPGGYDTGSPVQTGAIDMLRSNPSLAPQFDEKYGPGAAQKILGGQTPPASGGFPR